MYAQFFTRIFALICCWSLFFVGTAEAQPQRESIVQLQWKKFSTLQISPGSHHYGILRQDKWVSALIHNPNTVPVTYYIRFYNPHLNEIEGYKNFSTAPFVLTGDWFEFQNRPIGFRDFLIPIIVPPLKTDSLLFRLNKRGESLSIEYQLMPATDLEIEMNMDYLWLGVIVSFVLLVAGVAFFMGFNFRQPLLFIFSIFSVLALAWQLNNMGIFFQYIWPSKILWHYKSRTFFSVATISVYLLFLYQFFRSRLKFLDRVLFISFGFFLAIKLYGVLTAPQVEHNLDRKYIFVFASGLALAIFLLYLIYFFIRNFWESRPHRFHLVAFFIYTFLILHEVLLQFGISIFPFKYVTGYAPFFFFLLQILMMIIGLSVQINQRIKSGHLKELFLVRANERAISTQQFQILENERNRIGRDIHDQLGGLLVSIKLNLSNLKLKFFDEILRKELDRMRILVDSSINQLHQIVHDLVPPKINADNFHQMVNERIRLFEEVSSIHFTVNISLPEQNHPLLFTHIYRIICELISNSVQHSQCTSVNLECKLENQKLRLQYADNGNGFTLENKKEGRGLHNIEERVTLLQGRIDFTSSDAGMSCLIEFDLKLIYEANNLPV